jgi:hypothetical protein
MQRDFEGLVFQFPIEFDRIPAWIQRAPGCFDATTVHHFQQGHRLFGIVAVRIMRKVPHGLEAARPIPEQRKCPALAGSRVKHGSQDDFAQLVADRLEEYGHVVRLHGRSIPLPIEHQAILGLQLAVVQRRRFVRGRFTVLKDGRALLNVDNREDQIRRQQ